MLPVFWVTFCILFYTYFGYALLLILLTAFRRRKPGAGADSLAGGVTVIIPAYNEAVILQEKIQNTLTALAGIPGGRIILITDGSDDGSDALEFRHPGLLHLHQPERRGKSAAINRAMKSVVTDYVVITDANTMVSPDAYRKMLEHYHDARTGGVSGEKRVMAAQEASSVSGEGMYWKYESFLKKKSAQLYTVVGAAGELFSFRRALFVPLEEDAILDDFVLSMRIVEKGYRVAYEPQAYAMEQPSRNISDEFGRKVRISSGVWQTLGRLPFLFNPFRNFALFFQFVSHRFLRWTFAPLSLLVIFIANIFLLEIPFYRYLFYLQVAFCAMALTGFLFRNRKINLPFFFVPFYYCMMNFAVLMGLIEYLSGKHSVLWKKAER